MQAKAKPEAQLGDSVARVMSLGGSVVAKVSDYTQASVSDSSEVPSHCCP